MVTAAETYCGFGVLGEERGTSQPKACIKISRELKSGSGEPFGTKKPLRFESFNEFE
jgi:hypothetical protein